MSKEPLSYCLISGLFSSYDSKVSASAFIPQVLSFLSILLIISGFLIEGSKTAFIGLGAVIFISAIVIALLFRTNLKYERRKEQSEILSLFNDKNQGKADLSPPSLVTENPEAQAIGKQYGTFLETIRQLISEIRRIGIDIAVDSTKVATTVMSTADKTQQQRDLSQLVSTSSDEANQAISEVSQNAQYVSEKTTNNLAMARQSSDELSDITEKIGQIHQTVESFNTTVEELGQNSTDILDIVNIINNISEQTNLLSLNATIEAARAAEHGKGFAVVAEEVRDLARRIKPATEKITENIKTMIDIVEKTRQETSQILEFSKETNIVVQRTTENFGSLISDFEIADDQLMKIAAAIEELSTNNNESTEKVVNINSLSESIAEDMESSGESAASLNEVTEKMLEMVASFRTGEGSFDSIISRAEVFRQHYEDKIVEMSKMGINVFDDNYREVPGTSPQKYENSFTNAFIQQLQPIFDENFNTIAGAIYCLAIDRNGYLPAHHSVFSQPMTGDPEVDLLNSRHQRIFFNHPAEKRRCTHIKPLLLQTYMRDTGEILNDLSMPIYVNRRHWGALIIGLTPQVLLQD